MVVPSTMLSLSASSYINVRLTLKLPFCKFEFFEINSNLQNGSFNVSLTFMYDDADNDSIVDGTTISETSLEVYFYDGASWVTVPNPVRDTIANTITVVVDHFTTFALLSPQPPPAVEPAPSSSGSSGSS